MTASIKIHENNFIMHWSGVLYWQEQEMLLISDVHLGKVSHFRKFGAAVPHAAIMKNFKQMHEAIAFFSPKLIVFMGDLFHSSLNHEWTIFENWVATIQQKIILVSGNHDVIAATHYQDLKIDVVDEICLNGFLLTHHPEERNNFFNFAGHIHPAIKLTGLGRESARLSCFYKTNHQMILPAFGEFTGTFTLEPCDDCEVFALLGDTVLPVPITIKKRRGRRKG